MSWQRPIFGRGIPGANRAVVNTWMRGASSALDNADVMRWGRAQMAAGNVVSLGLCKVKAAIVISPNRWRYTVEHWFPPSLAGGGITPPLDLTFTYTNVQNLREYHNTVALVDGMDVTNPPVIVGPVGSVWNGVAFAPVEGELRAKVNVYVIYATDGSAWPYFDRPNPVACDTVEQFQGE
jgi:hypothetical protein